VERPHLRQALGGRSWQGRGRGWHPVRHLTWPWSTVATCGQGPCGSGVCPAPRCGARRAILFADLRSASRCPWC